MSIICVLWQGGWPAGPAKEYWLDFGANKYRPYAIHGGATDLHMPFIAQVTALKK